MREVVEKIFKERIAIILSSHGMSFGMSAADIPNKCLA